MANVPNTNNFSLQDVYNSVSSHDATVQDDLVSCFDKSVASYFDSNYGSKTMDPKTLYGFRNYSISIPTLAIGDSYGCGIVGYIYLPGDPGYVSGEQHGIITTSADINTGVQWYNGSFIDVGTTDSSLGSGGNNTSTIISVQGAGSYAASVCNDYSDGCSDWVLPSENELRKLYDSRAIIGGFSTTYYWSSTETNWNLARAILFTPLLSIVNSGKQNLNRIRPIRYF